MPKLLQSALLMWMLTGLTACQGGEVPRPLLLVSGPNNFIAFEVRDERREILWQLESKHPVAVPALTYGTVPEGFRQTLPPSGPPRPFELAERLEIESNIPGRRFVHMAIADSAATALILESAMSRTTRTDAPGDHLGAPQKP